MERFTWAAAAAFCLLAAGCGDQVIEHRHPPHDPPDYHGVPTDTRPPSMLDTASPASGASSQ
ncbi:MAG TPA: hypothetical protein VL598_03905 [Trinickia sp.]|nr:hypothetical protein [Trinickia sp.]HTI16788.1 hypothetical protein [Trinickia sp.]